MTLAMAMRLHLVVCFVLHLCCSMRLNLHAARISTTNVSTVKKAEILGKSGIELEAADAEATEDGRCTLDLGTDDLNAVLREAVSRKLEEHCPNFGSAFGWWGAKVCPDDFASVQESVNAEASAASGGKSGAKVIITPKFVIKTITKEEMTELRKLVERLSRPHRAELSHNESRLSFLAPTCRAVKIADDQYLQIMPNSLLQKEYGPNYIFDLKGNFAALARQAKEPKELRSGTLKDGNFKDDFPTGMMIEKVRLGNQVLQGDDGAMKVVKMMIEDTKDLRGLKLLDYSILVDIVDLCPDTISVTGESNFTAFNDGRQLQLSTFQKTALRPYRRHGGRPIYANEDGEFIYYWKPTGEWHIGVDYMTASRGLAAKSQASCPSSSGPWLLLKRDNVSQSKGSWTKEHGIALNDISSDTTEAKILRQNPDKPLLWMYGGPGQMKYLVTFSTIDVLMHEKSRGAMNYLASGVTFTACKTYDIDPIPAAEYRVRFLRMFGYKDPDYEIDDECGACLSPNIFAPEYTYFRSLYQKSQAEKKACEWGK